MLHRRSLLGVLAAGATFAMLPLRAHARVSSPGPETPGAAGRRDRWAALAAGAAFGSWTIEAICGPDAGAIRVQLRNAPGDKLHVDICKADRGLGAPSSPAGTSQLQLFLANEGDGATQTKEEQGWVAMAMARAIDAGPSPDLAGLMTLRERLAVHGHRVVRGVVC